jgi:hypothetical protein
MSEACRQRYKLATGKGLDKAPAKTAGTPGFRRGGAVRKQAGGQAYRKGGKTGG